MSHEIPQKINTLVVGEGAREHAVILEFEKSSHCGELFIAPGNAGTEKHGTNLPIDVNDTNRLVTAVEKNKIDFVFVGPEVPLENGLADALRESGHLVFGHSKAAAEIEASKRFGMEIAKEAKVPHARTEFTETRTSAHQAIDNWPDGEEIVVKADGLAAGKGVTVTDTKRKAHEAVDKTTALYGEELVLQERLYGSEFSLHAVVVGRSVLTLPVSRDRKNGGKGNTGGLGTFSPVPGADKRFMYRWRYNIEKIAAVMEKLGRPLQGILYPGLMAGRLIEQNCRFGDPEAQAILPRIKGDILPILYSAAQGELTEGFADEEDFAVTNLVMAEPGYPHTHETGHIIAEHLLLPDDDVEILHAGTKKVNEETVTTGGRVLSLRARGKTPQEAAKTIYALVHERRYSQQFFYIRNLAMRPEDQLSV